MAIVNVAGTASLPNPSSGIAYAVQINGFSLKQLGCPGRCNPVVTPPSSFPVSLGNLAAGTSASVSFTIDFSSCHDEPPFLLEMPWSQANGADSPTFVQVQQP